VEKVEKKVRIEAKRLLRRRKWTSSSGMRRGPCRSPATPCFITAPEETGRLVWNQFCVQNLAKFVHDLLSQHREAQKRVKPEARRKKVVGVVARGARPGRW